MASQSKILSKTTDLRRATKMKHSNASNWQMKHLKYWGTIIQVPEVSLIEMTYH